MKKVRAKFNFQMLLDFQLKLFRILFKDYNINKEEMKYIFSQVETIENLLIICFYRKLRSIFELNLSLPSLNEERLSHQQYPRPNRQRKDQGNRGSPKSAEGGLVQNEQFIAGRQNQD